ncbi:MAG TPA: hypothetical protein VHX49_06850 [Candidatus Acidoferrales bacterium]|jgi:hypothetical protein|nr:hypothetical protein [Candidatus Acidoferrales bacterium]
MSSGFNTDVRVGDHVFHVQTEDRGPHHPIIDTTVYQNGRVFHRRTSDYQEFKNSAEFSEDLLRHRVEEQHRVVVEDLRGGPLAGQIAAALEKASAAGGIQVQLLNPGSWLTAGNVSLDVEILRRADRQPQAGVQVDAAIEGALRDGHCTGTTDDQGRVRIQFPLPPLGKGDLALVIHAKAVAGKDEIRFTMRSRAKTQPGALPPHS